MTKNFCAKSRTADAYANSCNHIVCLMIFAAAPAGWYCGYRGNQIVTRLPASPCFLLRHKTLTQFSPPYSSSASFCFSFCLLYLCFLLLLFLFNLLVLCICFFWSHPSSLFPSFFFYSSSSSVSLLQSYDIATASLVVWLVSFCLFFSFASDFLFLILHCLIFPSLLFLILNLCLLFHWCVIWRVFKTSLSWLTHVHVRGNQMADLRSPKANQNSTIFCAKFDTYTHGCFIACNTLTILLVYGPVYMWIIIIGQNYYKLCLKIYLTSWNSINCCYNLPTRNALNC